MGKNLKGGYEKLDSAIGKAKIPWIMASMGYDFLKNSSIYKTLTLLYGIGFGVTEGHNKWSSVNTTKNNIYMGLVNSYIGLMHDSGMYNLMYSVCC